MTEEQARAICRLLRTVQFAASTDYWFNYCRCCKGRSRSYGVTYRDNLNMRDQPIEHANDCPVPVVEAMLITNKEQ